MQRSRSHGSSVLLIVVLPFLAGSLAALLGSYWDDAWHTTKGRDAFLIAPHITLYAGVLVAGGGLSLWACLVALRDGTKAVLSDAPLRLALLAVGATLAAAPIDNAWHTAFGRDAVLWSPPHVLGVVGLMGLAIAVLALVRAQVPDARWAMVLRPVLGGAALAAATFLVAEYETDVPQFDEAWYLPVLCLVSLVALGLVRRADPGPWAATHAAGVHLGLVGLVTAFLLVLGYDAPMLPLLAGPALALDLGVRRKSPPVVVAAAYVGALFALYVPWANVAYDGVHLDGEDVLVGLPVAFAIAVVAIGGGGRRRRVRTIAATVAALALLPAGLALAHDPGQGREVGALELVATVRGGNVAIDALVVRGACAGLAAHDLVARRSHRVLRAPLRRRGCRFSGAIALPGRGRWFVYLDLRHERAPLEAWAAVKVGEDAEPRVVARNRSLYVPATSPGSVAKTAATVALYGVVVAFLLALGRLTGAAAAAPRRR